MNDYINDAKAVVGEENTLTEERVLKYFSYDNLRESTFPAVVVFPGKIEEIRELIKIASAYKVPIVPRGSGTGRTGGAASIDGKTIVVSMLRFNHILDIDEKNRVVITEAGVINADLQREVQKCGLFYPPDPASMEMCTIGGNIAENAGGPRAVKYGVTSNYILNLTAVFGNGLVYSGDRYVIKNVSSYNIPQMLVASEGTFGIIVKSAHRLLNKPETIKMAVVSIKSSDDFVVFFNDLMHGKVNPMSVEFLDHRIVNIMGQFFDTINEDAYAALLIEIDGNDDDTKMRTEILKEYTRGKGEIYIASKSDEIEKMRRIRRAISPTITNKFEGKFSCDIVVPVVNIPKILSYLEGIGRKYGVEIMSFGHAGDGNLHVNVLYNGKLPRKKEIEKSIISGAIELNGTITGEHGIGIRNLDYLNEIFTDNELQIFKSIKRAFDPGLIMNPGKKTVV